MDTGYKDKNDENIILGDMLLNPFFGDLWKVEMLNDKFIVRLQHPTYEVIEWLEDVC
jgi:hypothetical protein